MHSSGSASYDGRDRKQPLPTLTDAIGEATAGDTIVLLDGHTETVTAAVAISKRLTIVGDGQSSGKPTVKYTCNSASESLFTVSAAGCELRNIWFEEQAQSNSGPKINVTASLFRMIGCYVECNGNDVATGALYFNSASGVMEVRSSTFISTATAASATPNPGIYVNAACTRMILNGVVLDGGTYGFNDGWAYKEGAAVTQLVAENLSLLRGADMAMFASTLGFAQPTSVSGDPAIDWDRGA